jgi:hypothetical protein
MEVSGQLNAPAALPQGKSPWCSVDMRLGMLQSRSEGCGEGKNLALAGIKAGPSLYRQSCPNSYRSTSNYLPVYFSRVLLPFVGPWPRFQFLDLFTHSVGLLGWGISPLQGHYLHTGEHKNRIKAHMLPCLKWDWNPRSQCLSGENSSWLRRRGHCDRHRSTYQIKIENLLDCTFRPQNTDVFHQS